MQIQQQYGTEAIKRFSFKVLDLAKLDKDGDGKVSPTEWGQAVFALVPELLNIKQLNNEVRDLTVEEVTDIVMTIAENFPDYRNLTTEVEDVVRAALRFLATVTAEGYNLLLEVKKLNKQTVELEVNANPTTKPTTNTEAKKAKTAGKK